ncbi:MAG: DUF2007 domain-containing protein [Calditrichaeota bacterium]|nr:DUF2007 domain-containing protein [Calditrichota bacterium]
MKLVEVYRAESEREVEMVQGLLESHGIRCILAGAAVRLSSGDEATSEGKQIRLMVPQAEVDKARKVLDAVDGLTN